MKQRLVTAVLLAAAASLVALPLHADSALRHQAANLFKDGNFQEALAGYRKLILAPDTEPAEVGHDLRQAIQCAHRLNKTGRTDELVEGAVQTHSGNWRLLLAAAQELHRLPHHGVIVAGTFRRGHHRGGGRYANVAQRDRIRSLQLMREAIPLVEIAGTPTKEAGQFFLELARLLRWQPHGESWRLQILSDLETLPDPDDQGGAMPFRGRHWGMPRQQGAPVDSAGNPVLYEQPATFAESANDGERWRWALQRAVARDPGLTNTVRMQFAAFLHGQFGVQTMGWYPSSRNADDETEPDGPCAVHTLKQDETIARLATGVKRFTLDEEYSFVRIFRRVADEPKTGRGEDALATLARIYQNRRQYTQAADVLQESIRVYGPGSNKHKEKQLAQIVGNWGRFERVGTTALHAKPTVEYRFRNGDHVRFTAKRIRVAALLEDVRAYLRGTPSRPDWQRIHVGNVGHRLVRENQTKYVGEQVADWQLDLSPRKRHVDRRITVKVPISQPGAYLLTATMDDGNTSRVILWVNDTIIVKKQLDGATMLYVADAVTGQPVPKANIELFGYRQHYQRKGRKHTTEFHETAELADANGLLILGKDRLPDQHRWVITCTGPGKRLAYLGFTGIWHGAKHDRDYKQTKAFTVTDRPVYRPGQDAQITCWIRHAQYDKPNTSQFANQTVTFRIRNPRNEILLEKQVTANAYGAFTETFPIPEDTPLGVFRIEIPSHGGGTFRVEEYRKPEFEVTVTAPDTPVMLGELIEAKVSARYYFGQPVANASVTVKVMRQSRDQLWYPPMPWDWFYGAGYWWFAEDYPWYPGWRDWGWRRPACVWWPGYIRPAPPELISEVTVPIGPDGTAPVLIDTASALAQHGDLDHEYTITAEVRDASRRTIVGTGKVLVARKPFDVTVWGGHGHYRSGDTIQTHIVARTIAGKPVPANGTLTLYQVRYAADGTPSETQVRAWPVATDPEGKAQLQIKAAKPGQYRIACRLTDGEDHTVTGGIVLSVYGTGETSDNFRFNDIEIIPDRAEFADGESARLRINAARADSTVLFFARPSNGVCLPPEILHLDGKSALQELAITIKDMPNVFVEALTVSNGRVHTAVRELVVPPAKRVLNVELIPDAETYKPGTPATIDVRVTDSDGKPFTGSAALTVYDESLEYISGGSNVPEIRAFFWKWRRHHNPRSEHNAARRFSQLLKRNEIGMGDLGVFGHLDTGADNKEVAFGGGAAMPRAARMMRSKNVALEAAPMMADAAAGDDFGGEGGGAAPADSARAVPMVRKAFADTAHWAGLFTTDANGRARIVFDMPENLTGWKIRCWAVGHGTRVGQAQATVVTAKDLMLRLQAPRFLVEKDEVVLSANLHSKLATDKRVVARLDLEGSCLEPISATETTLTLDAGGEARVDWRVRAVREGTAIIRMSALTDTDSDAMQVELPVQVHGMLKTDSFSRAIRPSAHSATMVVTVPEERRPQQTRLEVRYSPTLAGAMLDALPYLADYPYGCTEQTLNRFLPAVITRKVLRDMGIDLADMNEKTTNLNAQEIGDAAERAAQWKRFERNPVFAEDTLKEMIRDGIDALSEMQLSDGGWGWFSGWGERSDAHTTAVVVHGLQLARDYDVAILQTSLDRGVAWLRNQQAEQIRRLKNADSKTHPYKTRADELDALVFRVLTDAGDTNADMRHYLFRDRARLSPYGKALLGLAAHRLGEQQELAKILRNLSQYVVRDDENQTAYLDMPNAGYWWFWYGSEIETHAIYLQLLARTDPRGERAPLLVKYLLANRKHATYWGSTRDTALCVEAFSEFLRASDEIAPDMTVEILVDGTPRKEVRIDQQNLFTFDNVLLLEGDALTSGKHTVDVRRSGRGPLYISAYLTNFTLEDPITHAGLEIKVRRKAYRLEKIDADTDVAGARGQALKQRVEKFKRHRLASGDAIASGDLIEVQLEIDSKNDYEYLIFEDMKAAGFEPDDVRSGYVPNDLGAYVEWRDNRVVFFVRRLARGRHSVSYRTRAETPGTFSALPTRASAMYAPELRANSGELKLKVTD